MRSARTLFASAAVTAVLAVSVPAAYAVTSADDWNKDSGSSASSNDDREKPDSWKHEKPEGGVHAGGGALAGVTGSDSEGEKTWKHEKPEGGVHTGGGAMALSGSGLAAGSVLMLGGLGAAAYKLRRRNASGATAA
uniref:hypothetical protein n=1 Tax=Streptomyces sp. rh185 TaxID=3028729 RepID=UPI003C79B007